MKIGIDISQLAYSHTGVANYLQNLVEHLLKKDDKNDYVLFFSSLRRNFLLSTLNLDTLPKNVIVKTSKFPPTLLDILWNKLHIAPLEWFVGNVDIFLTSDWTEPPAKNAQKMTILYDLIVYRHPKESTEKIIETQKRKLYWVKKESTKILCISEATKQDAKEILGIDENRLEVVYPGV